MAARAASVHCPSAKNCSVSCEEICVHTAGHSASDVVEPNPSMPEIPPKILPIPKERLETSTVLSISSVYVMLDALAVLEAARAVMNMLEKYIM
jgi:hypothetical protein